MPNAEIKININRSERLKMVRAMEFVTRQINDEMVFENWLMFGVADGDIDGSESDAELEYYIEDNDTFAELMDVFLYVMSKAYKSGGLYCDGVVSKTNDN